MRLSDFIRENMEPILKEWENFARKVQPSTGDMNVVELRDHAEEMLKTIAADLEAPQTEKESLSKSKGKQPENTDGDTAAEYHADKRLKSGFSIAHLVSEFRALRASVLHLWLRGSKDTNAAEMGDLIRFNEAIDQALAESAERYSRGVMEAQDIFLGILGHDLRTPLQSVSLGAEYLMRSENRDSTLIQLGSRMFNSALRMNGMLNNLLDFSKSRIGSGIDISPVKTNLSDISEQVVEEYRSSNPGRRIRNLVVGDCSGTWDTGRIGQVYQNLIGNALQYGSQGGEILVSTCGNSKDVLLTVHNDGEPIPEDEQPRIFDLFRRHIKGSLGNATSQKNLGLGLYIAREIVTAHQGNISVASTETEGTTFTVRLPKL